MKHASWLRLSVAAGFAGVLLFGLSMLARAVPQAAVSLSCAPSPPYSISRGMVETVTWLIDPGINTPDYVDFTLFDPDNLLVDTAIYSGTAALSVTRYYTVPTAPKEGSYWARIKYFSVEAGQEAEAAVKFYIAERGNLHVFKFNDANGNRVQDPAEEGVPNIKIKLRTPFGDEVAKLTDATGWATWDKVAIGSYAVTETVPAGWEATLPPTAAAEVRIDATTVITFANRQLGNLHVFKFEDANGNSSQDAGEGPVQGVTVTLQSPQGDLWTKATGADGQANWDAIPIGAYRVTETLPAGWTAILPPAVPATVTFNATTNVTFANRLAVNSCIIGRKIDDLHRGLPGWTIHVRPRDAQGPVLTTVTDGHGDFYFAGLTGGWWTVWEEMQPGWAPVTEATFDVPLPPGPSCVEVGFKNRQACARDPYEPDDTAETATLILSNGVPQKHTLEPPSDLDWVTFDAVAGAIYTISTDNLLGSTDTYLTLYSTDDTSVPLAYNDDIAPGDKRSEIVWRAPATGRYFARVRDFYQSGARGCMAYDLILAAQYRTYLPLIVAPPPPPPATPTPTPSLTPTITSTPSPTLSPTPTRTPVPMPPPLVIPGLRHPKGIGINLSTHHLYVASRDTDMVYEVDPITNPATVVRSIPVGHEPFGVAVNSTTGKVYVANFLGNSLSVISRVTGTVIKTIPFPSLYGEPTYVAINEDTNRIYVPLHKGGRLAVIRGDTDTLVTTIAVGAGAWGVAVDPVYNRVFVSCRDDKPQRVWTIDGATNAVMWDQLIYPGGTPYALAVDAVIGRLYVSFAPEADNPRQVLVYRLPDTEPSLLTTVLVGNGGADGGGGVVANPTTHHVFVTNSAEDSVTVFDGFTNMVLDWVTVGHDPQCVAVDPGSSLVWVGNRGSNSVSGIPDGY
jgi:YVTN family beta-propeller protein